MFPVVGVFLFSEPHEAEILLAKLHVEQDLVTHWVAVENAYTQKGHWKGNHLRTLIDQDQRFHPFRDRLTVISLERQFVYEYRPSFRDRVGKAARQMSRSSAALKGYEEAPFHFAANSQRDAATETVRELAGGKGWVILTDADEMVDGSSPQRRALLEKAISNANIVQLPRRRYVYDFDNVSMAPFRHVPMARVDRLDDRLRLSNLRVTPHGVPASLEPLAFEYSYCYPLEGIRRKLATFSHVDAEVDAVTRALECNHAVVTSGPVKNYHWFERVEAAEAQHPAYVAERIETLKTNVVADDYHAARARIYPELFGE